VGRLACRHASTRLVWSRELLHREGLELGKRSFIETTLRVISPPAGAAENAIDGDLDRFFYLAKPATWIFNVLGARKGRPCASRSHVGLAQNRILVRLSYPNERI